MKQKFLSHKLYPKLLSEFHPVLNDGLTLLDYTNLKTKVWWQCEKSHQWKEFIYDRMYFGYGCPYCSNHRLDQLQSLAVTHAYIIKIWHPTKNGNLTPFDVTFGSRKRVWWLCENGHESITSVANRVKHKCHYCSRNSRKVAKSKEQKVRKARKPKIERTLAILRPDLISQWHPTKNLSLTPFDVTAGSHKKVWWLCDHGHEWDAKILHRTLSNSGCPYCTNKKIHPSNCLAKTHAGTEILESWHPTKNLPITPFDVVAGTDKKVFWLCKNGHEWISSIRSRTVKNTGCPFCSESRGEKQVKNILLVLHIDFESQKKFKACINKRILPFDLYLPKYNALIEYDGLQHFEPIEYFGGIKGFLLTQKNDSIKNEFVAKNNISLLRIPYTKFDSIKEEIVAFLSKFNT